MMNFKDALILFFILVWILISIDIMYGIHWLWYAFPIVFIVSATTWGVLTVQSGYFVKSIYKGDSNEKAISFTFDDGPITKLTPALLDLLNEYNVKATFFCIGDRIAQNPAIAQRADSEGHLIGNHSWSHSSYFDIFPAARVKEELEKTSNIIRETIGKVPRMFRPPYGITNPPISRAIHQTGFDVIGWNIRSLDTVIKDPEKLFARVTSRIKPGAVILFHDSNPRLLPVLRRVFDFALENEYKIIRLDELLHNQPYV